MTGFESTNRNMAEAAIFALERSGMKLSAYVRLAQYSLVNILLILLTVPACKAPYRIPSLPGII